MDNYNERKNITKIDITLLKDIVNDLLDNRIVDNSFITFEGEVLPLPIKNLFEVIFNILYRISISNNGFVSSFSLKLVNSKYLSIVKMLSELNIINVTTTYSISKNLPKQYTIINKSLVLENEIELTKELIEFKEYLLTKKQRTFLKYNNWNNVFVNISKQEALNILKVKYCEDDDKTNYHNIQNQLKKYNAINNQNVYGGFASDGRLYSQYTSICKDLRKLVYIDPITKNVENMLEFDIHATHPFLLPNAITNILRRDEENPKISTNHTINKAIQEEILKYKELLTKCSEEDLDFYTELYKMSGIVNLDRDIIKTTLLAYINNEKTNVHFKTIDNIFHTLFPAIRTFMINKKRGGYNVFNSELVKLETTLIMPICKELVKNGITIISVHDCLMFRQSQEHIVKLTISKHMQYKECVLLIWKDKTDNNIMSSLSSDATPSDDFDSLTPQFVTDCDKSFSATMSISYNIIILLQKASETMISMLKMPQSHSLTPQSHSLTPQSHSLTPQLQILNATKTRKRASSITTNKDGRYEFKKNVSHKGENKEDFKKRLIEKFGYTETDFKEVAKNEQIVDIQQPIINKEEMIKTHKTQIDTTDDLDDVLDPSSDIVEPTSSDEEDDFVKRMIEQFGVTYPSKIQYI